MMYIDQYGNKFFAKTVKELRSKIGGGGSRVSKLYRDKPDGKVVHVGYVVGRHWLSAYVPFEREECSCYKPKVQSMQHRTS